MDKQELKEKKDMKEPKNVDNKKEKKPKKEKKKEELKENKIEIKKEEKEEENKTKIKEEEKKELKQNTQKQKDKKENNKKQKVKKEENIKPKEKEEQIKPEQKKEEQAKLEQSKEEQAKLEPKKEENNNEVIEKTQLITKKQLKKNKLILISVISAIILICLLLFSTIFALMNVNNTKIIKGVYVEGIDVSDLTIDEAKQLVNETLENRLNTNIVLKYEEYETIINPEQIDFTFNIDKAIEEAYNTGRDSNIIFNNYNIIFAQLFEKDIRAEYTYNQEELDKIITDISAKIPGALVENSYYIEEENLIITRGQPGLSIQKEVLNNLVLEEITSEEIEEKYIDIPVVEAEPQEIDIDKIHEEIYKEPKDAYFTTDPFNIYTHVDGVDFAISIEEAKKMIEEEKQEYTIPLKITQPTVTIEKIGREAFPHLLGTYSTRYSESNSNRTTNVRLATEKINEVVLMPGEVFSYNRVVGERTISAGYREAAVYENGEVVNGIGGGICQVSSTLYNAVLYANLEIVERYNHYFLPSYISAGRDATVSWGTVDFQFKNNRQYPIKIIMTAKNGVSKAEIYGVKEEVEYEVVIQSKITSTIPYTTKYKEDNNMESGTERVIQNGANGFRSETYKVLKQNGATVSTTLLSKDTYNATPKIVLKGTKGVPVVEAPAENPTPSTDTVTPTTNTTVTESTENVINAVI